MRPRIWVRSSRKYSVTRCYFVPRGDCRMFPLRNAIRFPRRIPVTATRSVQKPHARDVAKKHGHSSPSSGVARRSGHPGDRSTGLHRHRGAADRPVAETFCHRSDFSAALHILHARGCRSAARSSAPARHCAGGDDVDHARGAVDFRCKLSRDRPRCAFTETVSGADAAGGGFADDGGARARGCHGSGFNVGADHAGDEHGAGSDISAAVRLCFLRRCADAGAARTRIEAGGNPYGIHCWLRARSVGAWAKPPSGGTRGPSTGPIS